MTAGFIASHTCLNLDNVFLQLANEKDLTSVVHKELQFTYDTVLLGDFSKAYSSENWKWRKVEALFLAPWSMLMATYHVARAVLTLFSKEEVYTALRLAQRGLGWGLTLLSDAIGQWYVQHAEFHITCYQCNSQLTKKSKSTPGEISAQRLREVEALLEKAKKEEIAPKEFLNKISDEELKKIGMGALPSKVQWALTKEQFNSFPVKEILSALKEDKLNGNLFWAKVYEDKVPEYDF